MNWIEVAITTTRAGTDSITEVFSQAGIKGVIIQDPYDMDAFKAQKSDWDYIDESLGESQGDEVVIKGYVADNPSSADIIKSITKRMQWLLKQDLGIDIGTGKVDMSNVQEEDWAHNWKEHFKPQKVGDRIIIKPSWEDYTAEEGQVVLELDPGMAFGTGTHETTVLCIEALEKWIDSHVRLLDVGCGTGILAIAGLLLGAKEAIAVDLDLDAVRIAQENAKRNGVLHNAHIIHGDLMESVAGPFDIVVSNIIADAIIEISKDIKEYLIDDGIFIASGIILDRLGDVEIALKEAGLTILDVKVMGEWVAVVSRYE
ncbi:MAG TPA: 50S ribosomal protein L11 methyltransferase [Clostridia bacterium]|nr:50S ribosomal protein L11 methyltransferase [Clostridia bacterium]